MVHRGGGITRRCLRPRCPGRGSGHRARSRPAPAPRRLRPDLRGLPAGLARPRGLRRTPVRRRDSALRNPRLDDPRAGRPGVRGVRPRRAGEGDRSRRRALQAHDPRLVEAPEPPLERRHRRSDGRRGQDVLEGERHRAGRRARLPPANLEGTVARYNAGVAVGRDPEYLKDAAFLEPIATPPFYGAELRPATVASTACGLRIDPDAGVRGDDGPRSPACSPPASARAESSAPSTSAAATTTPTASCSDASPERRPRRSPSATSRRSGRPTSRAAA